MIYARRIIQSLQDLFAFLTPSAAPPERGSVALTNAATSSVTLANIVVGSIALSNAQVGTVTLSNTSR